MSPLLFLGAAVAGGIGAVLRYLVDLAVMRGVGPSFRFAVPERAQRDEGRSGTGGVSVPERGAQRRDEGRSGTGGASVPERGAQRRDEGRPAAARPFPWGILLVNVSGSFALGLVTAALPEGAFIVGAGLLGGYTTFSTAMLDTVELWRDGTRRASAFNAVGMLLLGLLAAGAGLALGAALR